jgi:hypothetical protein
MLPPAAALGAYALWLVLRPSGAADLNVGFASAFLQHFEPGRLLAGEARQAASIGEAWIGSLMLYWVEGRPLRVLLAALAGGLALAGLGLRLRAGKADAWIMGAYLVTFLLWPFNDQMLRFIFPALPVLVLYAFHASAALARAAGRARALGYALAAVLLASLAAPALAFIYQRAHAAGPYTAIVDWYRTPDLAQARARAGVHLALLEDMEEVGRRTRQTDRVAWVAPSYVALLAGRFGVQAPDARLTPEAYRAAAAASKADYLLLTAYHPRDTLSDESWRAGLRALQGYFPVVYAGARPGSTEVSSLLFKLK